MNKEEAIRQAESDMLTYLIEMLCDLKICVSDGQSLNVTMETLNVLTKQLRLQLAQLIEGEEAEERQYSEWNLMDLEEQPDDELVCYWTYLDKMHSCDFDLPVENDAERECISALQQFIQPTIQKQYQILHFRLMELLQERDLALK